MKRFKLGLLALFAIALLLCVTACEEAGSDSDDSDPLLESLDGSWSTGTKNLTLADLSGGPYDTSCTLVYDAATNTFESAISYYDTVDQYWTLYSGTRGTVAHNKSTGTIRFVPESEFNIGDTEWSVPDRTAVAYAATMDGDVFQIVSDGDGDGDCDAACSFTDDQTVDWGTDVLMSFNREPATLTVTGTVTFDPSGPSTSGTVNLAIGKEDLNQAELGTTVEVAAGQGSFTYSVAGVAPGNYMIGAGYDANGNGDYDEPGDYAGSYGEIDPSLGEINFPVFQGSTVVDFTIQ